MKYIPLTKGLFALVDDEDYSRVSARRWCVLRHRGKFYARASDTSRIYLHRFILGLTNEDPLVDHKDGNGLNNQKDNLRQATESQNHANSSYSKGSSRYRGVSWHKAQGKWSAKLGKYPNRTYVGSYSNEEDAAHAYDAAAFIRWGEFAYLNFPETLSQTLVNKYNRENSVRKQGDAPYPVGPSKYRGITWDTKRGRWQVRIGGKKDRKFIGSFLTEEEAARAWDLAAQARWPGFAQLNFPSPTDI